MSYQIKYATYSETQQTGLTGETLNLSKYIGAEFEDNGRGPKYDCWGLCIRVLEDEFGYQLPDFSEEYLHADDKFNIPLLVAKERPLWAVVETPEPGNVVLFNIGGYPVHVGVVVDEQRMLHIAKGINACIEKFTSKKWYQRVEGFYAYSKH